jgi:hypothetical protein
MRPDCSLVPALARGRAAHGSLGSGTEGAVVGCGRVCADESVQQNKCTRGSSSRLRVLRREEKLRRPTALEKAIKQSASPGV